VPAEGVEIDALIDQLTHGCLLCLNALVRVDRHEMKFGAHRKILIQDAPLKNSEALIRVGRES